MPARIVHVSTSEKQTTAIIELDHIDDEGELVRVSRWSAILKPQLDFNSRHVGYRVWVQPDDLQPFSEAEALADACLLIERVMATSLATTPNAAIDPSPPA